MAIYVDIDKLTYTLEKFNHRYVYDLPLQENDMYFEYSTLKTKPYKDITSSDRQRLAELTNELYDYIFFADDINNYASAVVNMQKFISEDFPDYVNEVISTLWTNYEKAITDINKEKQDIQTWFDGIKNDITLHGWFEFDNYIMLENVDYYHSSFNGNNITETISYNNVVFATRSTTINDSTITERISVTEIDGTTKLHDKTLTTTFNSDGTITSTVKNNM